MESWSLINTISEAVELIEEVGSPAVGIQFDVWHLWNTPDLLDEIEREAHRFLGVHINDYRSPTRGFADRVLPGDGVADVASILRALDRAGWGGYYDLEVFSDNGAWGTVYPDALWDVPPAELVQGPAAFADWWEAAALLDHRRTTNVPVPTSVAPRRQRSKELQMRRPSSRMGLILLGAALRRGSRGHGRRAARSAQRRRSSSAGRTTAKAARWRRSTARRSRRRSFGSRR